MFDHDWKKTVAYSLFLQAVSDDGSGRRFATQSGIAFEAKPTCDGTWHGYPIPWRSVPQKILDQWVDEKKVSRRSIKKSWSFDIANIRWALGSDEL